MHYVGMSGYRTTGVLQWDLGYVWASILVGAVFAALALWVSNATSDLKRQGAAAGLLTLGIIGMHFSGMTAVTVLPDPTIVAPTSLMSKDAMVIAAVVVTAIIMLVSTGGVVLDFASRNGHLRRLREALDAMPEGLAFYDASDRLVAWNARYEVRCATSGAHLRTGMPFAELLQSQLTHGVFPASAGREAAWLEERMAVRRGETRDFVQRTAAGTWLRITETRTATAASFQSGSTSPI